jgi:hypothetical protein
VETFDSKASRALLDPVVALAESMEARRTAEVVGVAVDPRRLALAVDGVPALGAGECERGTGE